MALRVVRFKKQKFNINSKMRKLVLFISLWITFVKNTSWAYPDFIGYGYASCLTCHYNGAGGGPLNDYGRGLFAAEIAARPFWNPKAKDEELAEQSGFLGNSKNLPYWFRPSFKQRGIHVATNLGQTKQKVPYYSMQNDVYLTLLFNQNESIALQLAANYSEDINSQLPHKPLAKNEKFFSKEQFLRWNFTEGHWLYIGLMDKVFGLRHPDHTSFSRRLTGTTQNDQTQGMVWHYVGENQEYFAQLFTGNPHVSTNDQQKGFSALIEWEPQEKHRWGLSLQSSESQEKTKKTAISSHFKLGVGDASSLMGELGFTDMKTISTSNIQSSYLLLQGLISLKRGFNLLSTAEHTKLDLKDSKEDALRWSIGLLCFPAQRIEYRLQLVTGKILSSESVEKDRWNVQSQLHLSL